MAILTVYKASAGSGKTFQLTTEYLKIIFRNPDDFKYILAVTFTHKATAEMKARILNELYNLSLSKESQVAKILCKELKCNMQDLFLQAAIILKKILHHYSQFHISTIDSFFQGIISSFARDLGLQANFSVELNNSRVLNAVVDALLLNLEKDPLLARWLIDFAEEKVNKGENWELKQEIKSLGKELFREEYAYEQLRSNSANRKEIISNFRTNLYRFKKGKADRISEIAERVQSEISSAGLTINDFSHAKSGVIGFFIKLKEEPSKQAGSRVIDASVSAEKWANKTAANRVVIIDLVDRVLLDLLNEAIILSRQYFTYELLLSNIYSLGILSDLQANISAYSQDHNLFLLDQSPWLINRLMDSNDAPFIYEKAGNQFQYFMIDEFQDTSNLQWKNFLPLIQNSLSQDKPCMLVGDVKQSIYRWRNSSWRTLAGLQDEPDVLKVLPLDTNWRSLPLIVRFNNSLFTLASEKLQEKFDKENKNIDKNSNIFSNLIPSAYEGLKQFIPERNNENAGYAGVRFLNRKTNTEDTTDEQDETIPELALSETRSFIDKLLRANYRLKDIAILVRNKREGTKIAEYLVDQKYGNNQPYRIISNETLYLEKSSAVKLLVAVIQWIVDDKDEINKLFLASEFSGANNTNRDFALYYKGDSIESFLPAELLQSRERLSVLPLFDLVEHIIFLLKLTDEQGQYPYLQAFIDVVHDYCTKESGDIPGFLEWWKENSVQFSISAPEEQDAIRIITIHKAKGLEFKAVIVPFCNWAIDHTTPFMPILWCDTHETEFADIGLVPIRYKSDIADSIFANSYYTEKMQTYVDNLNLLYVALTRARECLYIICEMSDRNYTAGKLINEIFYDPKGSEGIKKLGPLGLESFVRPSPEQEELIEFGSIPLNEKLEFNEVETELSRKLSLPGNRIHIRAHADEYFLSLLDPEREGKINRGLIIHKALSEIKTAEDVRRSLKGLNIQGITNDEVLSELEEEIMEMLKDSLVNSWFTPEWVVMSEAGIIEKGTGLQRPDRIMINGKKAIVVDYKTGGSENKKYRYQLQRYMESLRKMGFTEVKGYIWYLRLKKVEEVFEKN